MISRTTILGAVMGVLGLLFTSLGISPPSDEHDNYFHIVINDENSCSSTAVGPHALLTASHCLVGLKTLVIDGKGPANVMRVMDDGNDHSVIFLNYTFKTWAEFGPKPRQTEKVHAYHSPGNYPDMYSQGYVSGSKVVKGKLVTLYDLPTFYGSSGAAILNNQGQIVAVDSVVVMLEGEQAFYQQAGSFDLKFNADQYAEMVK